MWLGNDGKEDLKSRLDIYHRSLQVPGAGLESVGIGNHQDVCVDISCAVASLIR